MAVVHRPIEAEARLRTKNQITLPEAIVRALHAETDDVLLFEVDPNEPGVATARVLPRDFAGSLTGVFGTTEDTVAFIRGERDGWGE